MKTVYALIGFLEVPLWLYQSPSNEIDPADYESPEYRRWIRHFRNPSGKESVNVAEDGSSKESDITKSEGES